MLKFLVPIASFIGSIVLNTWLIPSPSNTTYIGGFLISFILLSPLIVLSKISQQGWTTFQQETIEACWLGLIILETGLGRAAEALRWGRARIVSIGRVKDEERGREEEGEGLLVRSESRNESGEGTQLGGEGAQVVEAKERLEKIKKSALV